MTVKHFVVYGDPFGKQRPRHNRYTNTTYTPKETKDREEIIAWAYKKSCQNYRFPDDACISLEVKAYFKIPKRATKVMREKMKNKTIRPMIKPDWDNIGKLIADALNGIAYSDDKNIVEATVRKFYTDEEPFTYIELSSN